MSINYICAWDKNKELTWSGTTYSLYKALKKKMNVRDYDMSLSKLEKKICKLSQVRLVNGSIKTKRICGNIERSIYKKRIKKINLGDDEVSIQIGDYACIKGKSYIYQDLSIDSLLYYKEKKDDLFQYSGYQDINNIDLNKNRDIQIEIYRNTTGIFTMSKWLKDNLINYTGIEESKVHHVGAGINIDVNKIENLKKTNNKILFVGRDFERKGGDLVYEAFKILKEKYNKDAELFIAGPKNLPYNELYQGVNFLGDLPYSQISEYFNECDIFCMPSRFEAYGLVFIEALVYGLPCIGRNEFAMKEFIQDGYNGFLIDKDDPNELALKMYNLLNDNEIKNNVISKRDEYINQYSWDTVADRIINIIKENN